MTRLKLQKYLGYEMLYLKYCLIVVLAFVFNGCGLGGQDIELPEKRPNGNIEGLILGGLYSGGTITAYTLGDADSRQFLGSTTVKEDGSFNLEFATQSKPVLIEARGGSYLDPSSHNIVNAEPGLIMSKTLMFNSGEVHSVSVSPFTHLITGLALYLIDNNSDMTDLAAVESANKIFSDLYSISNAGLTLSLEENDTVLKIAGDEKHGLLINALAKIAFDERTKKDDALKSLYHLSSLNNLIYEDIRSDGMLDGKSIYENGGGVKILAFGDQIIDFNFYRLKLAFAMQKSLDKVALTDFSVRKQQEDFVLSIAQSESTLFEEVNNDALNEITPEIYLVSNMADVESGEITLAFSVEQSLKLNSVKLKIDKIEYNYEPDSIYDPSTGLFSLPVSTTSYKDGFHELTIEVNDTFNNVGNLIIPITFDNSAPKLIINSAKITNGSEYLLQGVFEDEFSSVKSITVDGQQVELLENNQWEQLVTLDVGHNALQIVIQDELGNHAEFVTEIFFDESAPVIIVTSEALTKVSQFLLEGVYSDSESSINSITVNGDNAIINMSANKWSKLVSLKSGANEFLIRISDAAGNAAEFVTTVILDDLSPSITLTSSAITNNREFLLEGEYDEKESGVNRITVNGNDATILAGGNWSKLVSLSSGSNDFVIGIEDDVGNYTEILTKVILYEQNPVVTLTSDTITRTSEFTLEGSYIDGDFGVRQFTVNDEDVTLLADKKWSKAVTLLEGLNRFEIKIEDEAGNYATDTIEVVLDQGAPNIVYSTPVEARFSNNDGSYFIDELNFENATPLYVETNQLSLLGMEANKANLLNKNIPHLALELVDQPLGGYESEGKDIRFEYRYLINDKEMLSWQVKTLEQDSSLLLLPFVAETLSDAWYKVTAEDVHKIQIKVSDKAGNVTSKDVTFKAQFYVPDLSIQVNDKLDSISNGGFENRADYVDKEVIAVNYSFFNSLDKPFKIRISDDSLHSVTQEYDEVQRVNKVEKRSKEVWRKAKIKDLDRNRCPKIDGSTNVEDWPEIKRLWNFVNNNWQENNPKLKVETISVTEDIPVPDLPTEWFNYSSTDNDADFFRIKRSRYTLSYEFDYILDFVEGEEPLPRDNNPGLIKSVVLFKNDELVVPPCPNVNAIKTRTEYTYLPVPDYPKNNLNSKVENATFSSSNFSIFYEDGTEIVPQAGWFEVPANQTVIIKKYVKTPSLNLYTDTKVANPESITDYNAHRLDKKLEWIIGQNLILDTQFNPEGVLLDDAANIRQQVLQLEDKVKVMQRN